MIANTGGRICWFILYALDGQVARECRHRVEEAEDNAAAKLGDNREDEWERLDELFKEMQDTTDRHREDRLAMYVTSMGWAMVH